MPDLTPVHEYQGFWAKRDDLACQTDLREFPSGSKVRQFERMVDAAPPGAVLPCGAYLDPYYAAKAGPFLRRGDCLWIPGVRPIAALPPECVRELRRLGASV